MAARDIGEVSASETATLTDRRCPEHADVLRHAGSAETPGDVYGEVDPLAPARGLLLGTLLGAGLWIVIGVTIWLLY